MPDEISIDLQDLQEIMAMLPEPDGTEKRRNNLTQADVLIIAKIVQSMSHQTCAMGFTQEEITRVKWLMGAINRGILGIGWLIVSTVVVAILGGIGWAVKHGIAEVAEKGVVK